MSWRIYRFRVETGQRMPSEAVLRRIAAAARIPWPTVVHLRRFLLSIQSRHRWTRGEGEGLGFAGLHWATGGAQRAKNRTKTERARRATLEAPFWG